MGYEIAVFGILVVLLIVFFSISQAKQFRNKPIGNAITTAGIGAVLAGTFFGIVKDGMLNRQTNPAITLYIIFFFFMWYILTKFISLYFIKSSSTDKKTIDLKDAENSIEESNKPKIGALTGVFIGSIIFVMVLILFLSMMKQGGADYSAYNILVTVMIILAVLFSFFSGTRVNYESKVEILAYTFSYALVFGILTPVFVFDSFSLKESTTMTLIFFVWISLTYSITNFIQGKITYINRY